MTILQKKIDDVLIIKFNKFEDTRGFFCEIFKNSEYKKIIKKFKIKQINFSSSKKNVARGLHLQLSPKMGKMMRVVRGRAKLLALDARKKNRSARKLITMDISEKDNLFIYAPYYYARGFISLKKNTLIEYLCTGEYNKKTEFALNMKDKTIKPRLNLNKFSFSEKDKIALSLDQWFKLNKL
jgi:dTDP-4-dehydrorhamnose 3,5-epimerase